METAIVKLSSALWSNYMIILCLGAALLFTAKSRFVQIRKFKDMIGLLRENDDSAAGISSFQAFAISLSSRVGTGNIIGVVSAIAFGGPGAVFWMWIIAFLGAGTAFVEGTLSQIYKEEKYGSFRGGPAFYIKKGFKENWKWVSIVFAIVSIAANIVFIPAIQANSITKAMEGAFGFNTLYTGIFLVILLAVIIFGGVKRIARVAERVVPFMATIYFLVAIIVIIANISELPGVIALIFSSAFGANSLFGGIIGSAISMGVKRGVYSSESGMGTAPHYSAAAEVSHPIKQGLVQSFSVYIDTLIVCSATAFMILITKSYNVIAPSGEFLVNNIGNIEVGPMYTIMAIQTIFPKFGGAFVAIALFFFAFTTLMAGYYIGETNIAFFMNKENKMAIRVIRILWLAAILFGSVKSSAVAWGLNDIGVGLSVWINLIAILLISKPVFLALKDYEKQRNAGQDPVFYAENIGLKEETVWVKKEAKKGEEAV